MTIGYWKFWMFLENTFLKSTWFWRADSIKLAWRPILVLDGSYQWKEAFPANIAGIDMLLQRSLIDRFPFWPNQPHYSYLINIKPMSLLLSINFTEAINKLFEKLDSWLDGFVRLLPNLGLAIIVTIGFYFLFNSIFNSLFS